MYIFSALAAAQGLFLAGLLWFHSAERSANRWLAAGLVAFSLVTVGDVLNQSGAIERAPHLAYIFDWLILLIGPLVYCYVLALTQAASPGWRTLVLHAIPALLLLLALAPIWLQPAAVKLQMLRTDMRQLAVDPLLMLAAAQVLCYWVACVFRLYKFRARLPQIYSNLDTLRAGWLALLLGANLLLWAAWLLCLLIGRRLQWIESLATPVAIYGLGYVGLRYPRIFSGPAADVTIASAATQKYAKSALSSTQLIDMQKRLETLMVIEKPYLENQLTLDQLASRLAVAPHQLSQLLSVGLQLNFYDFINQQRVAEVQRCLHDPAYAEQSILEIAFASGFSSKATFNGVFKKHAGVTPSAYRSESV